MLLTITMNIRPMGPEVSMFSRAETNSIPRSCQFIHDRKEMLDRPGDPVERRNQDDVELAAVGVGEQRIKTRTPGLRAGTRHR